MKFYIQSLLSKSETVKTHWFTVKDHFFKCYKSFLRISVKFNCTEKKDLIESKKIICFNDFLLFKEMICLNEIKFVWFKQNIFEPNKYLFESN